MVAPAPHLNGHYTIFGEAVDGFEVSTEGAGYTVHAGTRLQSDKAAGLILHTQETGDQKPQHLQGPSSKATTSSIPKATQQTCISVPFLCCQSCRHKSSPPRPPPRPLACLQVIDAINALARGKRDNTATAAEGAIITDAGQLRKGTYTPDLAQM